MIVTTVLRSGGDYRPAHVYRLMGGVYRHLPGAGFVCLTDTPDDLVCETVTLVHDWPGWWAKAELFRPGIFDDRVLYLDLDSIVVGPLDDLAAYDGGFAALADFGGHGIQGSGVMAWDGTDPPPIYEIALTEVPEQRPNGRFDLWWNQWQRADEWQDIAPGQIVSYKWHCGDGVPEDARIIAFHGDPKPWETEMWRI